MLTPATAFFILQLAATIMAAPTAVRRVPPGAIEQAEASFYELMRRGDADMGHSTQMCLRLTLPDTTTSPRTPSIVELIPCIGSSNAMVSQTCHPDPNGLVSSIGPGAGAPMTMGGSQPSTKSETTHGDTRTGTPATTSAQELSSHSENAGQIGGTVAHTAGSHSGTNGGSGTSSSTSVAGGTPAGNKSSAGPSAASVNEGSSKSGPGPQSGSSKASSNEGSQVAGSGAAGSPSGGASAGSTNDGPQPGSSGHTTATNPTTSTVHSSTHPGSVSSTSHGPGEGDGQPQSGATTNSGDQAGGSAPAAGSKRPSDGILPLVEIKAGLKALPDSKITAGTIVSGVTTSADSVADNLNASDAQAMASSGANSVDGTITKVTGPGGAAATVNDAQHDPSHAPSSVASGAKSQIVSTASKHASGAPNDISSTANKASGASERPANVPHDAKNGAGSATSGATSGGPVPEIEATGDGIVSPIKGAHKILEVNAEVTKNPGPTNLKEKTAPEKSVAAQGASSAANIGGGLTQTAPKAPAAVADAASGAGPVKAVAQKPAVAVGQTAGPASNAAGSAVNQAASVPNSNDPVSSATAGKASPDDITDSLVHLGAHVDVTNPTSSAVKRALTTVSDLNASHFD